MNLSWLTTALVYSATYAIILPILFGIWKLKKLSNTFQILLLGLLIILVFDILILWFLDFKNTFLYFFSAIDLVLYAILFARLKESKSTKIQIIALAFLLLIFLICDAIFLSGFFKNGISHAVIRLFILALSLVHLSFIFNHENYDSFSSNPMLWVCLGISFYSAFGFLDIFNEAILVISRSLYLQYYMAWCIITILMYLSYCYAFYLDITLSNKMKEL